MSKRILNTSIVEEEGEVNVPEAPRPEVMTGRLLLVEQPTYRCPECLAIYSIAQTSDKLRFEFNHSKADTVTQCSMFTVKFYRTVSEFVKRV